MHTLNENYKAVTLISPKSITATETGTGVDVEGYEDDAMAVFQTGALGGTTETFDGTVETSVIGDFSDKVTACTFAQLTGTNGDNKIAAGKVDLRGVKKVRGLVTMSSTTASIVAMSILLKPNRQGNTTNSTTPA